MEERHQGFWSLQPQEAIIPGLPDEIAMDCLLRLPFLSYPVVKSVCHDWNVLLSHPSFLNQRRRLSLSDHLLFLVHPLPPPPTPIALLLNDDTYHPLQQETSIHKNSDQLLHNTHHRGPPLFGLSICSIKDQKWSRMVLRDESGAQVTIPMFCQCVAPLGTGKLILIGGWDPETLEPVPDVYVIELVGGKWRKGAKMTTARSFFACASSATGSTVYAAGGHDSQKDALRLAEVYDVGKDEWRKLPDMGEERDECLGMCWAVEDDEPRFTVVSGYGTDSQGQFRADGECFDPRTGSWTKLDGLWPFPRTNPRATAAATAAGEWWWVDEEAGEMKGFDWEEKEWKTVSRIELPSGGSGTWVSVTESSGGRVFAVGGGGVEGEVMVMGIERDENGVWERRRHMNMEAGFGGSPFSVWGSIL